MNAFSAFYYGGPWDGLLCVISKGFQAKDAGQLRVVHVGGSPLAEFELTDRDGVTNTLRSRYSPLVRAASKAVR